MGSPLTIKGLREDLEVDHKTGEHAASPAIHYFAERTSIPRFYQVHLGERHYETGATPVLPFRRFCEELDMP